MTVIEAGTGGKMGWFLSIREPALKISPMTLIPNLDF
jgi:hypothetical protein